MALLNTFLTIFEQKVHLHQLLNDLFSFNSIKQAIDCVVKAFCFNPQNEQDYAKIKTFAIETYDTTKQIELFLKTVNSPLVKQCYQSINVQLEQQNHLLTTVNMKAKSKFQFTFPDTEFNADFLKIKQIFEPNNSFHQNLNSLTSNLDCLPFEEQFNDLYQKFQLLNEQTSQPIETDDSNLNEIQDLCDKTKQCLLKSIENIYKKYLDTKHLNNLEEKSSLINEININFKEDIKLMNLNKLNVLTQNCVNLISSSTSDLLKLQAIIQPIDSYFNLFNKFIQQYSLYLIDTHFKSRKCLYSCANMRPNRMIYLS